MYTLQSSTQHLTTHITSPHALPHHALLPHHTTTTSPHTITTLSTPYAWLFRTNHQQADSKLPGVVQVAPGLSHSLHPDFYRHELSGSCERLGSSAAISAYLVEHPEHHLASKLGLIGETSGARTGGGGVSASPTSQAQLEDARGSFYEKMTLLFQGMEGDREGGSGDGGRAYGVSSAGLSLPSSDPMHVSWKRLLECADEAASKAGRKRWDADHKLIILCYLL